jgi:Mn2+/Fe2+ NRAMP family transporter
MIRGSSTALVISQVVLSITLPLPMIALLKFARRPDLMGRFAPVVTDDRSSYTGRLKW